MIQMNKLVQGVQIKGLTLASQLASLGQARKTKQVTPFVSQFEEDPIGLRSYQARSKRQYCNSSSRRWPVVAFWCLAMQMTTAGIAGDLPEVHEGCYLSRSYLGGVHDVLFIERTKVGSTATFQTAYCDETTANDCANVKFEEGHFRLRKLDANRYKVLGDCSIRLSIMTPGRIHVSQESMCRNFRYWGVHGIYTKMPMNHIEQPKICRE